jgi:hypothetical protein
MIVFVYSVKAYFYSKFLKNSNLYFSDFKIKITLKGNNDLFDNFEEFDLINIFLESFNKLSIEIEADFSFDLWIEEEIQYGD